MASFQDREDELALILGAQDTPFLLNFYGEAGIGKSRLLTEARRRILEANRRACVIYVDLNGVPGERAARPEFFLREVARAARDHVRGVWQDVNQVAANITRQLTELSDSLDAVYLMVDTTEAVQEDMDFWRWLEARIVSPLFTKSQVRQVFAGRLPVPWRRYEVRRAVRLEPLKPLPKEEAALNLLTEVLARYNPRLDEKQRQEAAACLHGLSFGHPRLSEELAQYAAPGLPEALVNMSGLECTLGQEVVEPLINDYLFEGVETPWPDMLRWASILDHFDALILRRYLAKADPELIQDHPDDFFVQGIADMRIGHALIVWNDEIGEYELQGTVRRILRRNFEILEPHKIQRAHEAASAMFDEIAAEYPSGSERALNYQARAGSFQTSDESDAQAEEEVS